MARQIVVLALVLFAVVGMAYATPTAINAGAPSGTDGAAGASNHHNDAVEAPVEAPVDSSAFSPAEAPSGATALGVSAFAGATVATTVAAFFYF
ncbi:hypothetical protein O6P43_030536 [Quillaja saponaria]|uniref:Anther-specific protein BCP1-like n=1 Tax=Quillaja saponaria TaxID=32244 RepID=A0AAD7KTI6_QUISA|nr:hypothetical protein O6P43_030536 [Quillaja saponaria]